jgi:MFS family permease
MRHDHRPAVRHHGAPPAHTAHTAHTTHRTPHTHYLSFFGTQNAFNTIASHIQNDTGLGDNLMTLLSSLGIIGLFFTFPAGYVNDRFGAMWTGLIGAVLTSAGYAGMSFTDKESYAAMLICLMLVGFGSGTSFLAALSTGLKTIPGYPGIPIITFFHILILFFYFYFYSII